MLDRSETTKNSPNASYISGPTTPPNAVGRWTSPNPRAKKYSANSPPPPD